MTAWEYRRSHDELCDFADRRPGADAVCRCDEYARVRANEQERAALVRPLAHKVLRETWRREDLHHAEAVAAKLVEVICAQEEFAAMLVASLRGEIDRGWRDAEAVSDRRIQRGEDSGTTTQ